MTESDKMKQEAFVDLQIESSNTENIPSIEEFTSWATKAILGDRNEITVRIVDQDESQFLNKTYRGKDYPTNVLSFTFEVPEEIEFADGEMSLLGDLVICKTVVEKEAAEQQVPLNSHWAHLVMHGCLHLQGYDHIEEDEAQIMEGLESKFMEELGFLDPYISEK